VPTGVDFYPVVSGIASDYVVGAADVDDGLTGQLETQPFRFRRWLFAQENHARAGEAVDRRDAAIREVAERVPDFLRRNVRGHTSAERFFHIFLTTLHDAGLLDDPNLDPTKARRAVGDAAAVVASVAGIPLAELALGNLVVTNSRTLIAVRLHGPMFLRRLKQQTDPRRPESQVRSVLVVSTGSNPGEGFEEMPLSTALIVARDISADLTDLDA
jgi:hypothetical protein